MRRREFLRSAGLIAAVAVMPAKLVVAVRHSIIEVALFVYFDAPRRQTITRLSCEIEGIEYGCEVGGLDACDAINVALQCLERDTVLSDVEYRLVEQVR